MEILGEIVAEVFLKILFRILRSVWIALLWLFNLGKIPYEIVWEKPSLAWRGSLALSITAVFLLIWMLR